eukprot:4289336-Amphidinium_carterae.1
MGNRKWSCRSWQWMCWRIAQKPFQQLALVRISMTLCEEGVKLPSKGEPEPLKRLCTEKTFHHELLSLSANAGGEVERVKQHGQDVE